jgi:hypothetical protein
MVPAGGPAAAVGAIELWLHLDWMIQAFKVFPNTPGHTADRERHCWVNCVSVRFHNQFTMYPPAAHVPAAAASAAQELPELLTGQFKDPLQDLYADAYGQAAAWMLTKDCKQLCESCPNKRTDE